MRLVASNAQPEPCDEHRPTRYAVLSTPGGPVEVFTNTAWVGVLNDLGVAKVPWSKHLIRRGGVAASVTASSCEPGSRAPRSLGRAARRAGVPNGSAS